MWKILNYTLSYIFFHGFMLYRTIIPLDGGTGVLSCPGIRDRGYIMVNGINQGVLERITKLNVNITYKTGDWLDVLVENQGHINYGIGMLDPKGILGQVTLNGVMLINWYMYPIDIEKVLPEIGKTVHSKQSSTGPSVNIPAFYYSEVTLDPNSDTFIDPMGWSKGQAFLNNFNLGRYWPTKGPQITLYVPAPVLADGGVNKIVLFELERAGETIRLIDEPIIDGPV